MNENRFSEYRNTFTSIQKDVLNNGNSFLPQKNGKKVRILAGMDQGDFAVSVVTESNEISLVSTELIKVRRMQTSRKEEMAILFVLQNQDLLPIFIAFAIDLENVISLDEDVTIVEIYNRYLYWQKMFNVEKTKISESAIKGLISELHILESLMFPKYGPDEAIRGWIGSESERKDYAYSDGIWYEAKAINFGKITVKIASIEQLEASIDGVLLISELEKTSSENPNGVRLFEQINRIRDRIDREDTDLSFLNKINLLGFSLDIISNLEHVANQYRYIIHSTRCYNVDESFPKIKRSELPEAIGDVSYDIILSEISNKLIDFR